MLLSELFNISYEEAEHRLRLGLGVVGVMFCGLFCLYLCKERNHIIYACVIS